eukprot:CAMPEP_0170628544 /NCGR_PEP_ID=MMETSP0224-20130122/32749_1 /TAXON_ID=285029 /ORGANISM="Togula jolla, Strain CCCM 725" /LENGTH=49 /DNA_ID=CAMNT_0010955993 /DNA_START=56 /DNA_END=205 /DNA_ORIENTATION=+
MPAIALGRTQFKVFEALHEPSRDPGEASPGVYLGLYISLESSEELGVAT